MVVDAGDSDAGGELTAAVHAVTERTLELVQRWLAEPATAASRLVVVTHSAVAAARPERPNLVQAALPGLLRSTHTEHPDRVALLDIDGSDASRAAVPAAVLADEPEVAIRQGALHVPRLHRADPAVTSVAATAAAPATASALTAGAAAAMDAPDAAWHVSIDSPGTLESLSITANPRARAPLGPGQVRVAVHAAGLNFADVVSALGLVDFGDRGLGLEGAGVVLEVAPDVTGLAPGDRVVGLIPEAFGPVAVTDRRLLARMPDRWSFVEAASVPAVFLTAYYALVDLAGLASGEAVLIHGAAGGVGMAALQLAGHLGAEIFATAHPRKWETLAGFGIDADHIASSRDAEFRARFLAATAGRGMDVVLDSLADELVDASLELLPRGGRFIEIGKTDIRDPAAVAAAHPGVRYAAFDLLLTNPDRIGEMLAEIIGLFERGVLHHLPHSTWDVRRAADAFRFLRESRHTGKLVLRVPQPPDPEGTILVTGGTGGLGALLARHLAEHHGARRLLLASRRGSDAPGARELITELDELGCAADAVACDVSQRADVERLLAAVPVDHPLTAVFHAAGTLDDGIVAALDGDRLRRVMAPKLDAAVHLHELTRDLELTEFVCFSSAAGVLGTPGQANYAAANAFLDALAHRRRAEGLPAMSLAFGVWERATGMTAHLTEGDEVRGGPLDMIPLSDELGLELIDAARVIDQPLLVPVRLDLGGLRGRAADGLLPAILSDLTRTGVAASTASGGSLARLVAAAAEADRDRILVDFVAKHTAAVLGHASAQTIAADRPFKEFGIDSLSAVELRNRLAKASGVSLPATLVFDHPTPAAVARLLRERVEGRERAVDSRRASVGVRVDEPVAIVGMACRYPGGVGSPDELWELVVSGRDAIGEFPVDRGWDLERLFDVEGGRPGSSYVRRGGFVYDAGDFDAEHFGISPREALAMDPQQRLLLECAWEACEDAGIDPLSLRGSDTGVFAGAFDSDYASGEIPPDLEGFRVTGQMTSVISGRVAYVLGLEGPAVSVDTACSSSLVALHLAAQALRAGECDLALAGGVTVLVTPQSFTEISRQRGLSPDGRCRAFGAGADGTGFSDGVGVLVLERLSVARERGHRVLGVVRASAVNQDGASNGLTAPSGRSQERVIRAALASAGLEPRDVDVVEAHGTGTTLGDPIEAQALIGVFGSGRDGVGPLRVGSLKSNIGHSQAAAGVGGVIKMVQAMRHGVLPATLWVDEPSPHVEWAGSGVELLGEAVAWPVGERVRRAGVSSFGISGTNAHVVLEEPPVGVEVVVPEVRSRVLPFVLSGSSEAGLVGQAARLRAFVEAGEGLDGLGVAGALALGRAHLSHRAVVMAGGLGELVDGLGRFERGEVVEGLVSGVARRDGRVGFVFPGQGGQWPGMAVELLDASPVFAAAMRDCEDALASCVDFSLEAVLRGDPSQPSLDQIEVVQPALFAIMVSLAALWRSYGVEPDAVVGHSQGEIAAAHVAGVLSLQDAARIVAVRSQALSTLAGQGGMMMVGLSPERFAERAAGLGDRVSIAAINGPASLIVSGELGALDELLRSCQADGVWARAVASTVAGHCAQIEVLRERMLGELGSVSPGVGVVPVYSTVVGGRVDPLGMDAEYWYRNLRQTVLFAPAVAALAGDGVRTLIEVGPHPVLLSAAAETVEAAGVDAGSVAVLGSLRRSDGGLERFLGALAEAFAVGVGVDWSAVFGVGGGSRVALPTYAFQRRRYWLSAGGGARDASALGQASAEHPLLDAVVTLAGGQGTVFTGRLSVERHRWLADHVVLGRVVVPAAVFVELALHAGAHVGCEVVDELMVQAPLVLDGERAVVVQVVVSDGGEGRRAVAVFSRPESVGGVGEWTQHAVGVVSAGVPEGVGGVGDVALDDTHEIDPEDLYDRLAEMGFDHGLGSSAVRRVWRRDGVIRAEVELDGEAAQSGATFFIHPALLDAALQPAVLFASERGTDGPVAVGGYSDVWLQSPGADAVTAQVTLDPDAGSLAAVLSDDTGRPVASLRATLGPVAAPPAADGAPDAPRDALLEMTWRPVATAGAGEARPLVLAGGDLGLDRRPRQQRRPRPRRRQRPWPRRRRPPRCRLGRGDHRRFPARAGRCRRRLPGGG